LSPAAPSGKAGEAVRNRRIAWRDHDHTRGSLWTALFVLAVPLLTTSLAQAAFQLLDLSMVTRLGETPTTAVIVTNQSVRQIFFMLTMGISFGAQALVSRHIGAGEPEAAEHVAGQVLLLGGGLAAFIAGLGLLAPRPILAWMNVSPEVLEVGVPYLRLTLLLAFGFVFSMLFTGILQGAGDSATPMKISIAAASVSLGSEWLLIFGHGSFPALGILGVACGLAVGQLLGVSLALRVLFRGTSRVHLRLHHLRPDIAALRRIFAVSWQPGLQMIGGFVVTVFFLRLVGGFGGKAQAAYSIGLRLGMVGPMLAFPLAGACATLVGQNLGAGNPRRAWKALGVGLGAHLGLLWSVASLLLFFRVEIISFFAQDPEVIRIGSELMVFQAGSFFFFGFSFVFMRALQGAGDVTVPMLMSLGSSLLLVAPLGLWLSQDWGMAWGPTGVFTASLVGAGVSTLLSGSWVATGRWTRRRL